MYLSSKNELLKTELTNEGQMIKQNAPQPVHNHCLKVEEVTVMALQTELTNGHIQCDMVKFNLEIMCKVM